MTHSSQTEGLLLKTASLKEGVEARLRVTTMSVSTLKKRSICDHSSSVTINTLTTKRERISITLYTVTSNTCQARCSCLRRFVVRLGVEPQWVEESPMLAEQGAVAHGGDGRA